MILRIQKRDYFFKEKFSLRFAQILEYHIPAEDRNDIEACLVDLRISAVEEEVERNPPKLLLSEHILVVVLQKNQISANLENNFDLLKSFLARYLFVPGADLHLDVLLLLLNGTCAA